MLRAGRGRRRPRRRLRLDDRARRTRSASAPPAPARRRADDRRDGPRRPLLLDRRTSGWASCPTPRTRGSASSARGAGRASRRASHARAAAAPRARWPRRSRRSTASSDDEGIRPRRPTTTLAAAPARLHARRHDHRRQRLPGLRRRRRRRCSRPRRADAADEPLAEVVGRAVVAGPDSTLHLRPAEAARKLLAARTACTPADIALWEINEAFAGVTVAAAARPRTSTPSSVNVNGGAVALGHPLAASGFRLVLTLAHQMRRRGAALGVATHVRRRRPGRGRPAAPP